MYRHRQRRTAAIFPYKPFTGGKTVKLLVEATDLV